MRLSQFKTHQMVRVGTQQWDFFEDTFSPIKGAFYIELMETRGQPTGIIRIQDKRTGAVSITTVNNLCWAVPYVDVHAPHVAEPVPA